MQHVIYEAQYKIFRIFQFSSNMSSILYSATYVFMITLKTFMLKIIFSWCTIDTKYNTLYYTRDIIKKITFSDFI